MFTPQSSRPDLWAIQQSVSQFWKDNHIFEQSIESRPASRPYRFYDGPPFVTGLPHYGHLASSVAKDVIPRYQTMLGKRVERVWGWDCHGIPIEQKVQDKLGLTSNAEIEKVGVERFIQECYNFTNSTSEEREWYVDNFGRWVDFEGSYKTMDNSYMESVWRVFKQIWDKGLIYKGKRVSLYSTKLETPISNFEVAMDDSYDEVNDPAITVKFALKEQEGLGGIMKGQKVYLISGKHALASTSGYFGELESDLVSQGYDVTIIDHVDPTNPSLEENIAHFAQFDFDGSIVITHSLGASTFLSYLDNVDDVVIKHLMMIAPAYGDIHSTNPDRLEHSGYVGWFDDISFDDLSKKISCSSVVKSDDDILSQESFSTLADLLGSTLIHEEGKKHFFSKEYAYAPDAVRDYFLPDGISLLARTTTPWTIPANIALGVNQDLDYAVIHHEGAGYVVAKARVEDVFKGKEYEIVSDLKGSDLVGLAYEPPLDYYTSMEGKKHIVVQADFATDESGTGIVHQAPEFGEDDFNLGKAEGLLITEVMNSRGEYTEQITDMAGMYYRDANPVVTDKLQESGHLFAKASITHRVAFCPRTHIPLVYKAQDSRFIDIQSIKDRLLAANEQINRYPEHFKYGRFAKSIESAPDRCISRSRYWGTPMPVYAPEQQVREQNVQSEDVVVIGSREELYQKQKEGSNTITKFHLVRHGEAIKNVEGWEDIRGESSLTDKGREDAAGVANQLSGVCDATVYISPMPRTFQTILPYLTDVLGLDHTLLQNKFDKQLTEFHQLFDTGKIIDYIANEEGPVQFELTDGVYVDWRITEGLLTNNHGPDAPSIPCSQRNWYDWNNEVSPNGGSETMVQMRARFQSFVESVESDEVIVVSHADPLVVLQSVLKKQGEEGYRAFRKKHYPQKGSVSSVYYLRSRQAELDMHVPYIDDVWFEIDGQKYVRIPDVLDSRMESGSMPYGQMHYPFENQEKMEASFPADYIVEYTGQIRAWFYVMHVLGVILFDKPAYTNVICHGVVSGNDGRKMSKSLKNYPDPKPTFEQYGGDAIRMSILTSPLFNAGDTSISEENIADALRGYILPLWNAFSFFTTYANIDQRTPSDNKTMSSNVLDKWILGELSELTISISTDLDMYDLQHSSRALGSFLDNLTNRYIRRSRRRFWKTESSDDKNDAYQTLYDVLLGFCKVAAPFMPFVTEYIYKELTSVTEKQHNSIHLTNWPEAGERDEVLARDMQLAQQIVTMGLAWRSQHDLRVRQPLSTLTVGVELSEYYQAIIREELNIKQVISDPSLNDEVTKIVKPDGKKIGPKFGKDVKTIFGEAKNGNFVEQDDGSVLVADQFVLEAGEYDISYIKKDLTKDVVVDQGIVMSIDATITPELELEGYVRDLVRAIQDARKEAEYDIADRIELAISDKLEAGSLAEQMKEQFGEYIEQETLSTVVDSLDGADLEKQVELGGEVIYFALKR